MLTITWHKALLAMLACLCAAAVSPYLSDIHDLDGRQLAGLDMSTLERDREKISVHKATHEPTGYIAQ